MLLRVVNSFKNLQHFKLFFSSKIFAIYFAIKVAIKWWNFFTMEKVVNPTFPKNNPFHQVYSMTTFEVVFSHPLGLTEDLVQGRCIVQRRDQKTRPGS